MKSFKDKIIIGIDHGYGNIKTANHCFPTGISAHDSEPLFTKDMLVYNGKYYLIGEGHKEFLPEKQNDEDYYVLTLAAIATELSDSNLNEADVIIAAGLPLTWTSGQKTDFAAYLSKNKEVEFTFRNVDSHIRISDVKIYPQSGMMYTEKFGTYQCTLAIREGFMRKTRRELNDYIIDVVLRTGTADIPDSDLEIITAIAEEYVAEIFRRLREHHYDEDTMDLYVCGGGGCLITTLFSKTYEDNVSGKLSDEMFMELSHKYEVERLELKTKIFEYKERLAKISEMEQNKDDFIKAARKFMEMETLTAPMLRELIDHIDVYEKEGGNKNYTQRIVIYYRFVGFLELPETGGNNYKANTRKGVDVEYIPTAKSA